MYAAKLVDTGRALSSNMVNTQVKPAILPIPYAFPL